MTESPIVYEPGQVSVLWPFLNFHPDWFLLGGPADASEAQDIKAKYPKIRVIGFEPNPNFCATQEARGFPGEIVPVALWEDERDLELRTVPHDQGFWMEQRSCSAVKFNANSPGDVRETIRVKTRTLDSLSEEYGPFTKAILWIDIEESELYCLRGAVNLLKAGQIRLINAEVHDYGVRPIADFLRPFGVKEVHRWNANTVISEDGHRRDWWNIIYRRD